MMAIMSFPTLNMRCDNQFIRWSLSFLWILSGCGSSTNPVISLSTADSVKSTTKRSGSIEFSKVLEKKVAIIRLNNPDYGDEALDKDIEDGIKQDKTKYVKHTLVDYDAKGEIDNIRSIIDKAIAEGADIIVTLLDSTTDIAFRKKITQPVVFAMANQPFAMGFGKSDKSHETNITGAYLPHHLTLTVEIARGSLPKANKLAILFDPTDILSSIHKDALLRCNWESVKPLIAPYQKGQDWSKLMTELKTKDAAAILLTNGLGPQSTVVISEAEKVKLPVFGTLSRQAVQGAIFTREPSLRWSGFEVGRRVARLINGDLAVNIPFAEGDHYVTVVNTAAAKRIGVTILPAIMRDIKDVSGESFVAGAKQ